MKKKDAIELMYEDGCKLVDLSEDLPHQSTNSKLAQLLMDNFSTTFEIQ